MSPPRASALAVFLLLASPVRAEDVAGARAAFEQGAVLANEGRWSDALGQFELSATKRPHATTSYNLGFCERALGHPTRAKRFFAQALARDAATSGQELTPELRAATQKYHDEVDFQIATPEVTLVPADVTISVDGRPLEPSSESPGGERLLAGVRPAGPGEKPPRATFVLEIDAGAHELVIVGADGRTAVSHEYFPPQTKKKLTLALPPPKPTPRLEPERPSTRRTWGLFVGGAGVAAVGAGAFFGLRAASLWSDAKAACPGSTACPDDRGATLSANARTWANLSTVTVTVGAAALVGSALLVWTAPSSQASVSVGLGSLSISSRF